MTSTLDATTTPSLDAPFVPAQPPSPAERLQATLTIHARPHLVNARDLGDRGAGKDLVAVDLGDEWLRIPVLGTYAEQRALVARWAACLDLVATQRGMYTDEADVAAEGEPTCTWVEVPGQDVCGSGVGWEGYLELAGQPVHHLLCDPHAGDARAKGFDVRDVAELAGDDR